MYFSFLVAGGIICHFLSLFIVLGLKMYMYIMVIHTYLCLVLSDFFFSENTESLFPWKSSCVTCSRFCHRPGVIRVLFLCVWGILGTIIPFVKGGCFPDSVKSILHSLSVKMLEANWLELTVLKRVEWKSEIEFGWKLAAERWRCQDFYLNVVQQGSVSKAHH